MGLRDCMEYLEDPSFPNLDMEASILCAGPVRSRIINWNELLLFVFVCLLTWCVCSPVYHSCTEAE